MIGAIPMRKKSLLAVLMAMVLLLSGCSTIIVKDQAVEDATPILTLGDEVVTRKQVLATRDNTLYQQYYMYASYGVDPAQLGFDITDPDTIAAAQNYAVSRLKEDMALRAKAKELGLDTLTEEEEAKALESAQAAYDSDHAEVIAEYFSDTELEGDALEEAVTAKMEEFGLNMDSYYLKNARDDVLDNKLKDYITRDVTVTDEEIQADFDSKVEADKEKYAEDAGSWAATANGTTTLYYVPAGVRRVKQILIKFKDEDVTAISDAEAKVTSANGSVEAAQLVVDDEEADEEAKAAAQVSLEAAKAELEAAQAELDAAKKAAFANIDADADAVIEALANGGDWDALAEEKNEDPGMQAGAPNAERGYAVAAGMTNFDSAFVDAALALEKIGDVSAKIPGNSNGYYIIKYVSDEPEGPIALDSVKDSIYDALFSSAKDSVYTTTVAEWVEAAGIKENLGGLN